MYLRAAAIAGLCALTMGCASYSRLGEFGTRLADAKVEVNGANFSIWLHPRENVLLVQRGFGGAMAEATVSGLTLNIADVGQTSRTFRAAAKMITDPVGCTVTEFDNIEDISWEAAYTCPPGVDLRALIAAQRTALRQGEPIHP